MRLVQVFSNNFWPLTGLGALIPLLITGCMGNSLKIDVSDVSATLVVERFEQELFQADTNNIQALNQTWQAQYGFLYEMFCAEMISEGIPSDSALPGRLSKMIHHPDMREIYGAIHSKFSDFSVYQRELEEAFKHYMYYFPDSTLPKVVTFYSNFNANAFPADTILGIGLEMYLGANHELVKKIPTEYLPQFIKNKMEEKFLTADAMKYFLFSKFYASQGDDLLSKMIASGRVLYLLDAMMPEKKMHLKMGYTTEEWEWCVANEFNIWTVLIQRNYLYSKDFNTIQKFMEPGPFTALLPKDSPAMVGVWMGYSMVKNYVDKNGLTVIQVAERLADPKEVLKFYKPEK